MPQTEPKGYSMSVTTAAVNETQLPYIFCMTLSKPSLAAALTRVSFLPHFLSSTRSSHAMHSGAFSQFCFEKEGWTA